MDESRPDGETGTRTATYKDLRAATGLSLATISRYFNGGAVRDENRVAIEAAAARLRFRVNPYARGLRTRRSRTVGVLLPALDNAFHLAVIAGVEAELAGRGVGVVVASSTGESGVSGAVAFLLDRLVDGIIAAPAPGTGAELVAATAGLPLVLVDRIVEGSDVDAVVLDNLGAGRAAAGLALRRGHRRLAILAGDADLWSLASRATGSVEAARAAGVSEADLDVRHGPATAESAAAAVREVLALGRATAIVCLNRELTTGCLIALGESGTAIPGAMSLVGFDSVELARVVRPRLAVVVQPTRDIAAQAARLVLDRLEGASGRPGRRIVLPALVEDGPSVARPPAVQPVPAARP